MTQRPCIDVLCAAALLTAIACGHSAAIKGDAAEDTFVYEPPDVPDLDSQEVAEPQPEPDIQKVEDEDVPLPFDVGLEVDLKEADPDVPEKTPEVFTTCPTLGISSHWEGKFEGIVTYDIPATNPPKGLFLVSGDLQFDIKCLDQKLMVSGKLDGIAEAAGEVGKHPFAANLWGDFNYVTRTIKAKLLDGEVRLFKVISVYFDGNFKGGVQPDGLFKGEWDAVHTGNDLNFEGTSSGYGNWNAYPAPEPEP